LSKRSFVPRPVTSCRLLGLSLVSTLTLKGLPNEEVHSPRGKARLRNNMLPWWLAFNVVAMVFGVTHALLDAFLVIPPGVGVALALMVTILIILW
jgi:hypothetical protein